MSTEQQPPTTELPKTEPKAEPNALATTLTGGWEQFKQGQLISYKLMALILLVVAGIGTWVYISRSNQKTDSARWTEWDSLASVSSAEEFAKKNPNTSQARLAMLDVARTQLGPDGIDRFAAPDPKVRKTAVENVEKARESFTKLVDEFKDDPLLRMMCLLGCAKAESALVGMLKDDTLDQYLGDPKKAIEWLDKVAETAPDTDWGKDSKKLADTLRNQNTQQQVRDLQRSVYLIPTPSFPGFDPKMPKDAAHGFPDGFGP